MVGGRVGLGGSGWEGGERGREGGEETGGMIPGLICQGVGYAGMNLMTRRFHGGFDTRSMKESVVLGSRARVEWKSIAQAFFLPFLSLSLSCGWARWRPQTRFLDRVGTLVVLRMIE